MWYRFSIVATAALLLGGPGAAAAELPTYEVMGFPITQHQLVPIGSAHVQERSPTPALTLGGMPASPHQIAVDSALETHGSVRTLTQGPRGPPRCAQAAADQGSPDSDRVGRPGH